MRANIAIAIVAFAGVAEAAPRVVRGVVSANETGRVINGATVLTDRGEVAVTDSDGFFAITVTDQDRELTIAAPGFATRTIRVPAGDMLARIELRAAKGSEIIEVSGKAPEETKPLSYQLSADEIRFLPGAANDILRAAQALPGVSRIPFSFGGLVLRGTSPRDTAVYLDGIEVPIAFHFGGLTSFYPGSMLESLTLTSGGFDASYGRAQGGLVTLTTREPRTDVWRVGGSIGLLDSSVFAEGPWQGGGLLVGIRRSYLDTIIAPFVDEEVPLPSYYDVQLKTSFGDPRKRGRITPMIFSSIDRIVNDEISVTSLFIRAAAPYTRVWGPVTLKAVPWIGWTHLQFAERDNNGREDSIARPSVPGGARAELLRDYTWGHLRGGLNLDAGYLAQTEIDTDDRQEKVGTSLAWIDAALWAETRVKIDGERFALKPGVRVDYYGISQELVVDPRLNIHQRLGDGLTLRQAIGRFHQPPIPADVDRADGNPELDSSYMDQASLGLDAQIGETWLTSLTAFAGFGNDIGVEVARDSGALDPELGGLGPTLELLLEKQLGFSSFRANEGRARLGGFELLAKRSTPRWFFMLAYTLAWSQRTDDPKLRRGWRPFELDQRHNLNVAASLKLAKWRLGARVQFVTGNPYSPVRFMGELPDVITVQDPFGGRLPYFFHLDLRADRRWEREWGDINLYFDIQNVTNRRNIEGRDIEYDNTPPYAYEEDVLGLPIVPFIGVELIPN